jgi:hypothetical protein
MRTRLFVHPHNTGVAATAQTLRDGIARTCRKLRIDPPWMHGGDCKYGADIGLTRRRQGWLIERGLTLYRIDADLAQRLPAPAPRDLINKFNTCPGGGTVSEGMFIRRMRDAGLSLWEIGDLLGIHPHQLSAGPGGGLCDRPVSVLIELARQLDLHPADLIGELEPVLTNRRQPTDEPATTGDAATDALTVLGALAHARSPLTADELATALHWQLQRVQDALDHAAAQPAIGGPMALRRVPPRMFTITPRHDILAPAQRKALTAAAGFREELTSDEATILAAALTSGNGPDYADFRTPYAHAENVLKQAGLLQCYNGPHHAEPSPDVLFSLRLAGDADIAHERGELPDTTAEWRRVPHGVRWTDDPLPASGPASNDPTEQDPTSPQKHRRRSWRRKTTGNPSVLEEGKRAPHDEEPVVDLSAYDQSAD